MFEKSWTPLLSLLSIVLMGAFVAGCQSGTSGSASQKSAPRPLPQEIAQDPWVTATTLFDEKFEPVFVAGGIGLRLDGFGNNLGKPYYLARDLRGPEEKLFRHQSLFSITFTEGEKEVSATPGNEYLVTRNLKTGELRFQFEVAGSKVETTYQIIPLQGSQSYGLQVSVVTPSDKPELKAKVKLGDALDSFLERFSASERDGGLLIVPIESKIDPDQDWENQFYVPPVEIQIDGPIDDQRAVNSFADSISRSLYGSSAPMGLTNDIYFGHTFWDADIWVFPSIVLMQPELALRITRHRLDRLGIAAKEAEAWLAAGRPVGNGEFLGDLESEVKSAGIKFPWESGSTGRETVPGPSKYQDHITGSVVWSIQLARMLGLVTDSEFRQIAEDASQFYWLRSFKNNKGEREIHHTMSPDEHHTGNNDLYTNLLAEKMFHWSGQPQVKFYRPRDEKTLLTYDEDRLKGYKQAAAVLAVYPLQDPEAESMAIPMLRRFESGVIRNGPAMTESIHALIEARFGDPDAALTKWRKSWSEFADQPLLQFSEKRNSDRSYFYTGAAGCLQTVIYGFAGLRLDVKPLEGAVETIKLKSGAFLSVKPNLPSDWKSITLDPVHVDDKRERWVITSDKFERSPSNLALQHR